ncbi:MAG TPA: glycerol-3-phosphate ABC transporter ATP-binding protein [Pelagibacterium sp.]|mgnify:CR=1 FL=1|nr:glycerol-3-phosphate ABC transporter ATP-binding protein [Pelagibacterium sp.]|tara:strand:+ start:503 stop:1558 length:1056 start_codon:yes stop_codon:yes gene_type:complete
MTHIELDGIGKSFGAVEIFKGLNLSIEQGEFIVLVGPSGCGKSTLLRLIAGLEDITAGNLSIDGKRVNTVPAKHRDIAMVFQSYALYPHMTVAENMSFALKLSGVKKSERMVRAERAAEILGLVHLLKRLPRELSGGQRQRVAMGRAIVRDPQAFLFDEPLSNLDAKLRHKMRGEIRKLHQSLGRTTIYVTHDQVEAMTMADRIVVLDAGRIQQVGTPRQLFDDPDSRFVASFIGTPEINLFDGRVEGERIVLENGHLMEGRPGSALDGQAVTVGFRPQHLSIGQGGLPAEVILVETTGEGEELTLRLKDGVEIVADLSSRSGLSEKTSTTVGLGDEKAFVFDRETGERLR